MKGKRDFGKRDFCILQVYGFLLFFQKRTNWDLTQMVPMAFSFNFPTSIFSSQTGIEIKARAKRFNKQNKGKKIKSHFNTWNRIRSPPGLYSKGH